MITVSILVIYINIHREKAIDIFSKLRINRKALERNKFISSLHWQKTNAILGTL